MRPRTTIPCPTTHCRTRFTRPPRYFWRIRCLEFTFKPTRNLPPQLYSWVQNLLLSPQLQHQSKLLCQELPFHINRSRLASESLSTGYDASLFSATTSVVASTPAASSRLLCQEHLIISTDQECATLSQGIRILCKPILSSFWCWSIVNSCYLSVSILTDLYSIIWKITEL